MKLAIKVSLNIADLLNNCIELMYDRLEIFILKDYLFMLSTNEAYSKVSDG